MTSLVSALAPAATKPDWGSKYEYRRGWKTMVQNKLHGHEQRTNLQTRIRRELAYSVFLTETDAEIIRGVGAYSNYMYDVPLWHYEMETTAQIGPGTTSIPVVSTANRDMGLSSVLVIPTTNIAVTGTTTYSSYSQTQIVIAPTLSSVYPAGTKIYPAMTTPIQDIVIINNVSKNGWVKVSFVFKEILRAA